MGPPVALVAGVKALSEAASAATAAAGMTSPRGAARAFDARGGFVRGEGCVALLALGAGPAPRQYSRRRAATTAGARR
ncbi:hypothetical protein SO694_0004609 [Aureococcus anophagefferens]|uniref:Beta-ketoacyl synthase-like N-terminal domain-containing protein n=1 Tax=Aureococcus anophagefferens TaxID=44056 RepID=A0ABR1G7A3_AURAN